MKKFTMPWSVIPQPFPDPGAMNGAVRVNTQLVQYDMRGQGRPVLRQMMTFFRPTVETNVQALYGYGGLIQGQFTMQPLSSVNPTNGEAAGDISSTGIIS
jgi:hypothetical protein